MEINWNVFEKKKEELINKLLGDWKIEMEIEIATFLNELQPSHYNYLKGEWEFWKDRNNIQKSFLGILTQNFLDYLDENRYAYIRLIEIGSKDLFKIIMRIIKESSVVPYVYANEGLT